MKTVISYSNIAGKSPFQEWLYSLHDNVVRSRVFVRLRRVEQGNYGDHKRFCGIIELRFDFGKGYRVYCGEDGDAIVVLLVGGDKSGQEKDIRKAMEYREEYNEQKKI